MAPRSRLSTRTSPGLRRGRSQPSFRSRSHLPELQPKAPGAAAEAADGAAGESGEGQPKQPMRLQQTTTVEPLTGETCVAETAMPLPQGLGEMRMHFTYTPQRKDPQSSDVVIEVSVDVSVPVPMVGGMIARKILGDADNTIDKGLARIEAEGLSRR